MRAITLTRSLPPPPHTPAHCSYTPSALGSAVAEFRVVTSTHASGLPLDTDAEREAARAWGLPQNKGAAFGRAPPLRVAVTGVCAPGIARDRAVFDALDEGLGGGVAGGATSAGADTPGGGGFFRAPDATDYDADGGARAGAPDRIPRALQKDPGLAVIEEERARARMSTEAKVLRTLRAREDLVTRTADALALASGAPVSREEAVKLIHEVRSVVRASISTRRFH
jgi:hypothetical protein